MATLAAIPQNVTIQQGNGNVLLTWSPVAGSSEYGVQRSTDNTNWTFLNYITPTQYLDTTPVVGTLYYYQVASVTNAGANYSNSVSIVPTNSGDVSLGQVRLMAQQRADMVNSNSITTPEWNSYINQSYFELYDLLVTLFEDYYLQAPYILTTTGASQYALPTDFYKLRGVDCGLANQQNAWATLKRYSFESRNRYVYPQLSTTLLGVFDLEYRVMGSNLMLIPTPSSGQYLRVWYIPKLTQLLQDSDIFSGISGWSEYVVVDAAIKALQKEESDTTALMFQKQALIKRIEDSAANRDAGSPETISDSRNIGENLGSPWNGAWGGQ